MRGHPGHNTRPHARLQPILLGMDDSDYLTTERSFDSQATWVIDVIGIFLTGYPRVFVQQGTGRRPVDLCRN